MTPDEFEVALKQAAARAYERTVEVELKEQIEKFRKDLVHAVESQTLRHQPLNEAYRRRKEREGLSSKILIATGEYLKQIKCFQANKESWMCRPTPRRVKRSPLSPNRVSKLTYQALAIIHEHGVDKGKVKIPARPHWAPMKRNFNERAADIGTGLREAFGRHLAEELTPSLSET